jgi:hypothetical protein
MKTEKIFQNVVWVAVVVVLMAGLEVTGWADEDDDEKAEMRDFVAAVYRGQGQYNMAGSIATGEGGVTRDFSRKDREGRKGVGEREF